MPKFNQTSDFKRDSFQWKDNVDPEIPEQKRRGTLSSWTGSTHLLNRQRSKMESSRISTQSLPSSTQLMFKEANLKTIFGYGHQHRLGRAMTDRARLLGGQELFSVHLYREILAECFGTFAVVTLGCSAVTPHQEARKGDASLSMSSTTLSWGLSYAFCIWTIAHVSGSFLNPATAITMCLLHRISLVRCCSYVMAQMSGAVVGSTFHLYVRGDKLNTTCLTLLNRDLGVDELEGFVVEFFITSILLFFIFATSDSNRTDHGGEHAFMIGAVFIPLTNMALQITGASMNPARSFGPAFVHGNWDAHWIYWCGPIAGALLGGLVYDFLCSERVIIWSRYLQVGQHI